MVNMNMQNLAWELKEKALKAASIFPPLRDEVDRTADQLINELYFTWNSEQFASLLSSDLWEAAVVATPSDLSIEDLANIAIRQTLHELVKPMLDDAFREIQQQHEDWKKLLDQLEEYYIPTTYWHPTDYVFLDKLCEQLERLSDSVFAYVDANSDHEEAMRHNMEVNQPAALGFPYDATDVETYREYAERLVEATSLIQNYVWEYGQDSMMLERHWLWQTIEESFAALKDTPDANSSDHTKRAYIELLGRTQRLLRESLDY